MNDRSNFVESLFGNTSDYVKTNIDLFKLKAVDKSSNVVSATLTIICLLIIFIIVFFFINIGIALLIGDLIGKSYWGFFILTGFYIVTGLVLFSARGRIFKTPVANMMIRKFLKNTKV